MAELLSGWAFFSSGCGQENKLNEVLMMQRFFFFIFSFEALTGAAFAAGDVRMGDYGKLLHAGDDSEVAVWWCSGQRSGGGP